MRLMPTRGDLISFFSGGLLGSIFRQVGEGLVKGGAEEARRKINKMEEDDPRAAMFKVILSLGKEEVEEWAKRHGEARRRFIENRLVQSIGHALPKKPDGSLDWDKSFSMLTELVSMDKDEFEAMTELLNHDPVFELIRKGLNQGKKLGDAVISALGNGLAIGAGFAVSGYQHLDQAAERTAVRVNQHQPGRLVSLLAKLSK